MEVETNSTNLNLIVKCSSSLVYYTRGQYKSILKIIRSREVQVNSCLALNIIYESKISPAHLR